LGFAIRGPLPFGRFAADADELLSLGDPISRSVGHALMAAAALAAGDDPGFGEHYEQWRDVLDRHGLHWCAATQGLWIASVETSVGMAEAAERRLREAREVLAPLGNIWWLRLVDGFLCEAVRAQDRPREFLRLADAFAASVLLTDRGTLIERQLLLARAQLISSWSPPTS